MRVWGIADLHLSQANPERRGRFAARWADHALKIAAEWNQTVAREDLVVLPGDISMARNHRDLQPDLNWLESLPGTKVLSPGNHDAWWNGLERIRPMLRPSLQAVQGTAVEVGGVIVCGARGCSAEPGVAPDLERSELASLEAALAHARSLCQPGQPLFVLWHFPPHDRRGHAGPVVERLARAEATCCVFGHLHQLAQWASVVQGIQDGVKYACVAADAIGFRPIRLDGALVTPRR
jgi:predicted phosphohydrolase